MNILYVGYRDFRHSKFGGYDYIVKYPNADYLDAVKLPFGFIPVGKRGKKLNLLFLDIVARMKAGQYDVIHYFYSDFMLFFKLRKHHRCKFIATVHMKTASFSQKQKNILKTFDKVICLSSSEEANLRCIGVNAFFIPHGFNRPVFNYVFFKKIDEKKINIFYSGMNYRDFNTFLKISDFAAAKKLNVHFYAVGQSIENQEKMIGKYNITICPRLTDDEYYSLLSSCDYNFLPMTFATANNTLLEAQCLGVKSILPAISGVDDYACKNENIFYSSFNELKNQFYLLEKQSKNQRLIEFSEKFSWNEIYKQLYLLYLEK